MRERYACSWSTWRRGRQAGLLVTRDRDRLKRGLVIAKSGGT
jgi:hypothetical protein